jgi:hypothetical protein
MLSNTNDNINQPAGDIWSKAQFWLLKWQHHDEWMHNRINSFYTLQTVMFAIITIMIAICSENSISVSRISLLLGLILLAVGYMSLKTTEMMKHDKFARNSYNNEIIKLLKFHVESWQKSNWEEESWKPEEENHQMNNWHLYDPDPKNKKGKASLIAVINLKCFSWFEIVVGSFLIFACPILYFYPFKQ